MSRPQRMERRGGLYAFLWTRIEAALFPVGTREGKPIHHHRRPSSSLHPPLSIPVVDLRVETRYALPGLVAPGSRLRSRGRDGFLVDYLGRLGRI
ncbi:hypothetical protein F4809DRAFT_589420 [Biscogniauxia mediterranea]|nr:hypothetical protein F4809DRAFT_589420 [Biscogniauxia mediterranea]